MSNEEPKPPDAPTPVDDVRGVRERLSREAGGDIRKLADESRRVVEQYRHQLGLKIVRAPRNADLRTGS